MLMTSQQGINTYVCVSTPQHVNQVLVTMHDTCLLQLTIYFLFIWLFC
jgi:hypothetical protein